MNNHNSPITPHLSQLRGHITTVATPEPATVNYQQPCLVETAPRARMLGEFKVPPANDPSELIRHRFLCKAGGLLLVGQTGLGKSSLAMQFMIKWALGEATLGLEPARPLKSLLIQAENDDGDLAEMKFGVFNGLNLTEASMERACKNILVYQENVNAGGDLCSLVLDPLLSEHKPDLLWLDPALAYLGGDMNSQEVVGEFLRHNLNPLLQKHQCAVVIIHHTNKISRDPEKQMTDPAYLGAGSADWVNWSRAMLALRKTEVDNLYELIGAKRDRRLKWRTADGEGYSRTRYIGHSRRPDTICWMEMEVAEAQELRSRTALDVLKHVPESLLVGKEELIQTCQRYGIGKNKVPALIKELVAGGKLYEHKVRRSGTKPKILLGREQCEVPDGLLLEQCKQTSQGHYLITAPKPQTQT